MVDIACVECVRLLHKNTKNSSKAVTLTDIVDKKNYIQVKTMNRKEMYDNN